MATTAPDVYYDPMTSRSMPPYGVERLRDEAALLHESTLLRVSRFDDVERCLVDWRTYSSARAPSSK